MTKKQIAELFKMIVAVYPQFEVNQYKIDLWAGLMRNQNPAKVMIRAERYVLENKFPPTVADLTERITESHGNEFLDKVAKWERDAVGKPNS